MGFPKLVVTRGLLGGIYMDIEPSKRLKGFIEGKNKDFFVPLYQRHYNWKKSNCRQLYNDLLKTARKAKEDSEYTHFCGSIFASLKTRGSENLEYTIIDGQQRITSIYLLYLAIYNLLKTNQIKIMDKNKNNDIIDEIYKDILVHRYEDSRIKLHLGENDRDDYNYLLQSGGQINNNSYYKYKNSNIYDNYKYFYEQLLKLEDSGTTVLELLEAIARLTCVVITIKEDEKPQQIFESLNSTGLPLAECDKIRNLVFMSLPVSKQESVYKDYWKQIEENIGSDVDNLNEFIRDYLTIVSLKQPKENQIYIEFKNYIGDDNDDNEIKEMLEDMREYARLFKDLRDYTNKSTALDNIHGIVYRLGRLQMTTQRPLMLKLLRLYARGLINKNQVEEIFSMIENYIFRRIVCSLPSNSLKDTFISLLRELDTENIDIEKLKYKLISKSREDKSRFPDDKEFLEAFISIDFYSGLGLKRVQYTLERICNFGTKEISNLWEGFDNNLYSIEHIMPQTLNDAWKKELGQDWDAIHSEWINRIANLTISGYNTELRNRAFIEKRDHQNGYSASRLWINKWIAQQKHWGEEELRKRSAELRARALQIWSRPSSSYQPTEKQLDSYTLDSDNIDFLTNRGIQSFSLNGDKVQVKSWAEMYVKVLKILHADDKSVLMNIANSDSKDVKTYLVSNDKSILASPELIDEDEHIYASTHTSTSWKVDHLLKLFELYNKNPSDLVFYLKDRKDIGDPSTDTTK